MPRLERPQRGDPISLDWACAVVDAINELQRGPKVVSPLVTKGGVVALAQDYEVYPAITTGTITARSAHNWGSGNAKFLTLNLAGTEADALGFKAFTAWNVFGASIASGIRIFVVWSQEKWCIIAGDCSGVA